MTVIKTTVDVYQMGVNEKGKIRYYVKIDYLKNKTLKGYVEES